MNRRRKHKQVWVKVNAQVDEAVAEIITALGLFPHVHTIESCQGGPTDAAVEQPAWVCFTYADGDGRDWKAIAEFALACVGPELARRVGDGAAVSLRVSETGRVEGSLTVRPGAFRRTARALREIRRRLGPYPRP
jgi:hypothetical protein